MSPRIVECAADTIWIEGQDAPLFGLVERDESASMQFRATVDGFAFRSISINKNDIRIMVLSHDRLRLENLTGGQWLDYFLYGEELVAQRADPMARRLAIRMFAIVACNAKSQSLRDASFGNLIDLASESNTVADLRKSRFLETGVRQPEKAEPVSSLLISPSNRDAAVELIRAIRQQRSVTEMLRDQSLEETINRFQATCSWDELVQISKSTRINDLQLRQLVTLEHEIRMTGSSVPIELSRPEQWDSAAKRITDESPVLPSMQQITGMDPQAIKFQNGNWTKE